MAPLYPNMGQVSPPPPRTGSLHTLFSISQGQCTLRVVPYFFLEISKQRKYPSEQKKKCPRVSRRQLAHYFSLSSKCVSPHGSKFLHVLKCIPANFFRVKCVTFLAPHEHDFQKLNSHFQRFPTISQRCMNVAENVRRCSDKMVSITSNPNAK